MQYRKLVYLETNNDVDSCIRVEKAHPNEALYIAMTPSARAYAKKKGITSRGTLPYLTNESHFKLSLKSKELSDWLDGNITFVDMGFEITKAYRNDVNRWMKFFINYYLCIIEVVLNSCDSHKPQILMAPYRGRKILSRQYVDTVKRLFIQPEEKHMGILIKFIAENRGLGFEDILKSKIPLIEKMYFLKPLKNILFLTLFILLYLKHRLKTGIASRKMKLRGGPVILFTTPVNYMRKLAQKLRKNTNANFYFLQRWVLPDFGALGFAKLFLKKYSKSLTLQKKLSREFSEKIRRETAIFSHRGIFFGDILAEKFENDIAPYIIGLHAWTVELDKIMKKLTPSLVISSGNRLDDSITGELCRGADISAVMVSHGSFVRPEHGINRVEWGENGKHLLGAPFTFTALQSPLAEDYIKVFPSGGTAVKTGPLIWGGSIDTGKSRLLFKKMFNKERDRDSLKVIVHAATHKPINRLKFHIYETPDEYIRSLLDLVEAVRAIPDSILIVRFKPRDDFSVNDLKELVTFSDKVILSVEEPFLDILGMSDLLVSFSSTTITEAFQNKIPVLLYGGRGRYLHVPAYEIKTDKAIKRNSVYYIKNPKDLRYGISGILDLKLDKNKDTDLFESYIYKEHERVSLLDLLSTKTGGI